ncbi:MAG: hypothetical protein ACFFCO_03390 [Promethearchaeota archaeon]
MRRNIVAIILGLISGIILILTNTYASLGFILYVPQIAQLLGLTPVLTNVIMLFLYGLNYLAMLGGWTVLVGCVLILLRRYTLGAFLMSLGAGISLIALIWNLIQMWVAGTLTLAEFLNRFQGIAWAGAILSVVAQELVKIPRPKNIDDS